MHRHSIALRTLALAGALTGALAAHAQTATTTTTTTTAPAPGVAPVAVTTTATSAIAVPSVPGPNCPVPTMPKGPMRTKAEADALNASFDSYMKCVNAYCAEHQTIAQSHHNAANAAADAFNARVAELNAAVKVPAPK